MKNLIKASAAVIAAALFGACNSAQPTPPCAVGHGGYSALLTKTAGPETGPCVRTADIIGVQKYRQTDGSAQQIYLKPESISALQYFAEVPAADYTSLAHGPLTAEEPDADGFCSVATLTPAFGQTIVGEDLTYTFSNVEFFVRGSVAGTQFQADLTISDTSDPASCTATYSVRALYPVIFCTEVEDEDTFGEPKQSICDPHEPGEAYVDHVWSFVAANPLFAMTCSPYGNPEQTGADYDYAITGDTDWHICTPTSEVPSLLAGAQ